MPNLRTLRPPGLRVPGWRALRSAPRHAVRDGLAGLTVGCYLVPQCLAYARLAGLPAITGLWAATGALVVYALLGSSSCVSVGPDSASAILAGSAIATVGANLPASQRPELAAGLALAVAMVGLVAWAVHLSFLADLLSRPVLVGYLGGVAIVMIVSQLPNLLGLPGLHGDTASLAVKVATHLGDADLAPVAMGLSVVVALVALARFPRLPGPLLVVLGATAITSAFDLERHGVHTLGAVPRGLPSLGLPSGLPGHAWPGLFAAAAGLWIVAVSDDIVTTRAFASRTGDVIDADQELLAIAGANAAAGLAGGFPVTSSGSRTALALAAGGRTQLTSLVAAALVAGVLLVGGPVLSSFPLAALAGLVVFAAMSLIDLPEARRIVRFRASEGAITLATFGGVVLFGVLAGVGLAVALSVMELFARIARAHDAVQGTVPGLLGLHDIDDYPDATTEPGLVVYRYDAPLCFANAQDFHTRVLRAIEAETTPVEWTVLNVEANVEIDLTAADMLEDLRNELAQRGIVLALARVKHDLAVYLDRAGLTERIGREWIYPTLPAALAAFRSRSA